MVERPEIYLEVLAGLRLLVERGHNGAIVSMGGVPRRVRAIAATGAPCQGPLTAEAVAATFDPQSDTHDLGLVVLGGRMLAAHCQFPLPRFDARWDDVTKRLGSRHRAAMGMSRLGSEVLVLSADTGMIRIARAGSLFDLWP